MSDIEKDIVTYLIKKSQRPKIRRRERILRMYGTDIPLIKVVYLSVSGLVLVLERDHMFKDLIISLNELIPNFELLMSKKKLKHIFHEDSLVVDIYTKADGVIYTVDLMEHLFDELL